MNTTQIWADIVAYTVQIGLLVGIGASLPIVLRLIGGGNAPGARLRYWQLMLVACLALPWLRPWQSEVIAVNNTAVAATPIFATLPKSASARFTIPPVMEIALWLLAAGVVVRLGWLATGLLKLARYRRRGRSMPPPSEWTGMAADTTLLLSDEITGPVTFGLIQPVVLLPAAFPSMPAHMRDAILSHELLHVERRDWIFTVGEELVRAVFWFHPAIWWLLSEIQLAREQTVDQAVIEMTQARDPYVDTLLAMAGITTELDLASAPLFLRRRHLKQRVLGIVQEVRMSKVGISKTRLIFAQAAALTTMAAACWFITSAIPLRAQAQMVMDSSGVTVNLNGSQLMHRSPVEYPAQALAKGVEGTVVVQVRLDSNGEVIDDAVLSGPDELRKSVQQSVLSWHFDRSAGSSTRVVNIEFVKPANSPAAPTVTPAAPRTQIAVAPQRVITPAVTPTASQNALPPALQDATAPKLGSIVINGLSDSARDELLAALPIRVGDQWTQEARLATHAAVQKFDSHLSLSGSGTPGGPWEIRIETPDASRFVTNTMPGRPIPADAVSVSSNAQAANLITAVKPIYPPLAKMARQQGTVKFEATIGKDGKMEDLKLISGPPLLIPSAMDAVKQWTYNPTLVNGAPVEVVTTIDVNFSLSGGPMPGQQ